MQIARDGFWANITGEKGRVHLAAKFMGSELTLSASLELAKMIASNWAFVSMLAPKRKADFDDGKRALDAAIKQAGG